MKENTFALIITVVNRGHADSVMDTAKDAGAQGGTILHARGCGTHENEKFFGISITPEKDVVLIVVKTEQKQQIMRAITEQAELYKAGKGIIFALPVDDVAGITHMLNPQ